MVARLEPVVVPRFIVEGKATIQSGVKVAMNGGTVFVNPSIGANFSGGAGSGGAVRIVAEEIENLGFIEVRGGDASGSDAREVRLKIPSRCRRAGGGGRVALLADGVISRIHDKFKWRKWKCRRHCWVSRIYHFTGKNSFGLIQDLTIDTGTLIFDTGRAWYHSSGIREKDNQLSVH